MIGTHLARSSFAMFILGGLWVLVVSAQPPAQAAVLPLQNADATDFNGTCVDISGDTILVGGCCGGINSKGWAQVFVYSEGAGQWEHQETLAVDDASLPADARFGYSLGLDGDKAVVGAFGNNAVYSFSRVAGVWSEEPSEQLLSAASGFGYDVRIDQNRVIVGAQPADNAYVYSPEITNGQNLPASGSRQEFGYRVAISGPRAMVGDPGADKAYFYNYEYNEGSQTWAWVEEGVFSRAGGDRFGTSVAIDGDWAIVGADQTDLGSQYDAGSAVIYHYDGSDWGDPITLAPSELTTGDRFGTSVAISGNVAVVGAVNQGSIGSRTGSVYVFERVGDAWVQSAKLQPTDGNAGDEFGNAVAIDGQWIVVGAWYHDSYTGAAYVFETPSLARIPGDANLDTKVDEDDMAILSDHWQTLSGMSWTDGDFNDDHAVDETDASILAANWHTGVDDQTPPIPEPATIALLTGLFLMLAARRKR